MKKNIKSFISFTRTERIGLVCLCALLVIFIVIRATMPLWVHPKTDKENEQRLVTAWESFKRSQTGLKKTDTAGPNGIPLPNAIDLNTADSETLATIPGIGPVTAGKIMARRKNKGLFTSVDQLSELDFFSTDTLELLKKRLVVGTNKNPD